jgi:hypothetical protein
MQGMWDREHMYVKANGKKAEGNGAIQFPTMISRRFDELTLGKFPPLRDDIQNGVDDSRRRPKSKHANVLVQYFKIASIVSTDIRGKTSVVD